MNKLLAPVYAFFLILTVLFSGCTFPGGSQTGSGQGVIIENFEPDFSRVYAGENFKLQMKMRNVGSVNSDMVYTKLYNVNSGNDYEISCKETCANIFSLLPPDPDRGTVGESRTCIWNCDAPKNIPKGLSVAFNPSARLYYLYSTTTIKSINIISQDELRSLQNQGKSPPSETVSTTNSPVKLDIVVNGPIRYWENEKTKTITFPININIQNNGGGSTCAIENLPIPTSDPSALSPWTTGCEFTKNWNKAIIELGEENDEVKYGCNLGSSGTIELWKGQTLEITCQIEMPINPNSVAFIQKNIKARLIYAYIVDATTPVEVIGRDIPTS